MTISPAAFSVEPTASKPQEVSAIGSSTTPVPRKREKDRHVSDIEMSTSDTREYEYSSEISEVVLVLDSYSRRRVLRTPRHRIRVTTAACRVIAAPLLLSIASSSSFEVALPSCRRSPLMSIARASLAVVAVVVELSPAVVVVFGTGYALAGFVVVVVLDVERGKLWEPTTNYDYDNTPQVRQRSFELHELQLSPSTLPMQPRLRHQEQQWGEAMATTEPRRANAHRPRRPGNARRPLLGPRVIDNDKGNARRLMKAERWPTTRDNHDAESMTQHLQLAAKRSAADDISGAATGTASKTRKRAGDNHPSAANPKIKGKGDQDKKTISRKGEPLRPEENLDNDWEDETQPFNKTREESNEEALPSEGKDDKNIVKQLEREVQNLKIRCDSQEKTIEDLKSRCNSHEKVLELLRQEIPLAEYSWEHHGRIQAHRQDAGIGTMVQYNPLGRIQSGAPRANTSLIGRVEGLAPWANGSLLEEFSQEHHGPIQAHQQDARTGGMGQYKPFSRIQSGALQANTGSSAEFGWEHNGPIQAHRQDA
ncbi:hypothetical protein EDB89DRAFT_1910517 [Lactarius sanguifluus]|nr:hypothetical protein EDB89DRAFT_1910517 [Lactarius sanguifluus]